MFVDRFLFMEKRAHRNSTHKSAIMSKSERRHRNLLFDFQNGARPVEGGVGRAEVLSFVFVIFQDLYIQNITKCHTLVAV